MIEKLRRYYENEVLRLIFGVVFFFVAFIFDFSGFFITSVILYVIALIISGAPVFISAVRGILRRDLFDEKFLMSIASIGAMIIGDMSEGVAVMLFFLLGEIFEHKAVRKSRNSIKSLMNIRPPLKISDEFLKVQDEFLTAETLNKHLTGIEDIEDVDGRIMLWQGDITTLKLMRL